jgi:ELWxxDGT repeat protein
MTPTSKSSRIALGLAAGLTLTAAASAQGPASLVKDISTTPTVNAGGDCRFMANINGTLYFGGTDAMHGRELWVSDGTPANTRLLKDINPGTASGTPNGFTDIGGGVILFEAADSYGAELWRTDGTAAGTFMVKDINPGANASTSFPRMAVLNGVAYFSAADTASNF